jgi:hypothetical protein
MAMIDGLRALLTLSALAYGSRCARADRTVFADFALSLKIAFRQRGVCHAVRAAPEKYSSRIFQFSISN